MGVLAHAVLVACKNAHSEAHPAQRSNGRRRTGDRRSCPTVPHGIHDQADFRTNR
jgi:hypothetical protein